MSKVRLGVVALLPEPVATHVQAWRRALREPFRDAVAPHVTLVPPQDVDEARFGEAVALVERAAAARAPVPVTIDGAASFLPRSPVAFLTVGEGADALAELEAGLRPAPLDRRTHAFHPHVTVAQDLAPEEIEAAVADLAGFRATFVLTEIALMREHPGRIWRPEHLAPLGGALTEVPFDQAQAAYVLLLDGDAVLLGLRDRGAPRHPGAWDALGGTAEPGEALLAALLREAAEEAGVEPLDVSALGCFHDGERAEAFYLATTWRGSVHNAAPAEHERLEWVPLRRALGLRLPPGTHRALARLAGMDQSGALPQRRTGKA
jgi:2'-5' RNA ligase/8-oxo-dGTP pyrophosphatase MutT (NUDIX family)